MFFPYVHYYVISSNYEKGIYTQSQIWQSFCNEEEEDSNPLPLGGLALFIHPYG